MKVKKVRQLTTPNTRLRLSGNKQSLLSVCFVSSLHQFLRQSLSRSEIPSWKCFRPNGGFSHKNVVVDGGPKALLGPDGPCMKERVLPSIFCREQKCEEETFSCLNCIYRKWSLLENPYRNLTHLWVKNLRTATHWIYVVLKLRCLIPFRG